MDWKKARSRSIQADEINKERYRRLSRVKKVTTKQKALMDDLSIKYNKNMTRKKASELITKKLKEKRKNNN